MDMVAWYIEGLETQDSKLVSLAIKEAVKRGELDRLVAEVEDYYDEFSVRTIDYLTALSFSIANVGYVAFGKE